MRLIFIFTFLIISLSCRSQSDSTYTQNESFMDYSGIQVKKGISQIKFSGNGYSRADKFTSNRIAYEFNFNYDISSRSAIETGVRTSLVKQSLYYPTPEGAASFGMSNSYTSSFTEIPISISLKLFRIKRYSSVSFLTGYSFGWIYSDNSIPEGFQYAKFNNLHSLHLGARASIKVIDRLYFNIDARRTAVISDLNQSNFTSQLFLRHLLFGIGYKFGQCD